MKILVTGGSGLVGKALQEINSTDNENTWIYIRSSEYNLIKEADVHRMYVECAPDAVVHLAANVGGLFKNMNNKVQMYEDNLLMNTFVVSLAHQYGVQKLVCMCSTCVYPDGIDLPITEDKLHCGPPHPSNEGYAYAKRMLELHCRLMNECHSHNYVCIIPTNIYGPHDNFNIQDGHVIPCLMHRCFLSKNEGKTFQVYGTGKPLRQFVYSKDLAAFVRTCVLSPKKIPTPVNFCSDAADEISIQNVASMIASEFGISDICNDTSKADGQFRKTCSNAALRAIVPDFTFTPLSVGLAETVAWFKANYETCRK